jgi:general secretion pathway protein K
MSRPSTRQHGFALLIVLWSLALLALLGTQVLATARQESQVARHIRDTATLEAAADGAVQQAIFATMDPSSRHWNADGITRMIQIGRVPVAVRVEDEADKVNPNFASAALLQGLLLQVGADSVTSSTVAAAIVGWRSAGDPADRPNAVTARYVASGRAYAPTGTPFTSLDEVGAVLGVTPALLARLRPHLTVFTYGDSNGATHDPVVARALAAVRQAPFASDGVVTSLVSVTVDARGPGHARFAARTIVRTNAQAEGRRYDLLSYERVWDGGP